METGGGSELALVVVDRPESMNLLGLLMRGVLWDNLAGGPRARRALGLKGNLLIRAGTMAVTLRFDGERITIYRGVVGSTTAQITGSLGDLLGVIANGGVLRHILAGTIGVRGSLLMLVRILPLVRARAKMPDELRSAAHWDMPSPGRSPRIAKRDEGAG